MFSKILIANRGEIACRVAATARRMGVRTVAVYSDADAGARHVSMADEAVRIGPAEASESYLKIAALLEAAVHTGAEAVHPGYGFLSENPDFVEAVEAAGLVFIGPPAAAIRAMGLKDAAKASMAAAGVPIVPGYHGARQDIAFLEGESDAIGYPVLIKARAGGGGKGMRKVDRAEDLGPALEAARREAAASFGDPACLIEKYVATPRHIEIQVFADAHGNVTHLFERDCSLQRRHQKVIEEAPAPDMPPEVRAAMGAAAVEAARAIGYRGAGTVEFIADGSDRLRTDGFWFMEMNTRLQVEHPVTEAVTGLDLVELQLRVAAGEPLPFAQEDLAINGWSMEARLYAEDAGRGFLPATGTLRAFATPSAATFSAGPVRIDAGVREGDAVTPHYDPMIAKIITHGATRAIARQRLAAALEGVHAAGCVTNRDFLIRLVHHSGFADGRVDTGLIGRDTEALTAAPEPSEPAIALAALALLGLSAPEAMLGVRDPWSRPSGWRSFGDAGRDVLLEIGQTAVTRRVVVTGEGRFRVASSDAVHDCALERAADGGLRAVIDGHARAAAVACDEGAVSVWLDGEVVVARAPDPGRAAGEAAGDGAVAAPMPGRIGAVHVAEGDAVGAGQPLLVLEAMKMEHTLTAPIDGVVTGLGAVAGAQVTEGALLLRLEPVAAEGEA